MNNDLWKGILAFNFDQPGGDYVFSLRLARENCWTRNFTKGAILEYRKFMYLAATSDRMVSPSPVVDTVWHQHLIYTESYTAFCALLGKRIEHIPSTHDPKEAEKFRQAKERTKTGYTEVFGEQPDMYWNYADMFASLGLKKSRMKNRTFVLWGILGFFILMTPAYYTIGRIYTYIPNPGFPLGFMALSVLMFFLLYSFNRTRLANLLKNAEGTFLAELTPSEVLYLKEENKAHVIQHEMNELLRRDVISIHPEGRIKVIGGTPNPPLEETIFLDKVKQPNGHLYRILFLHLRSTPVYSNIKTTMEALKKYFLKSHVFARLFRLNFYVLAGVFMLGRLVTGIVREKDVSVLVLLLVAFLTGMIFFLRHLQSCLTKQLIPAYYEQHIVKRMTPVDQMEWQYVLLGSAALNLAFLPVIRSSENPDRSNGSSGCGSSCGGACGGSGCGGGCGGCGN
jgi:uncharacterized protein (TIGR04222 family)